MKIQTAKETSVKKDVFRETIKHTTGKGLFDVFKRESDVMTKRVSNCNVAGLYIYNYCKFKKKCLIIYI